MACIYKQDKKRCKNIFTEFSLNNKLIFHTNLRKKIYSYNNGYLMLNCINYFLKLLVMEGVFLTSFNIVVSIKIRSAVYTTSARAPPQSKVS